jgi:hypothetical protein
MIALELENALLDLEWQLVGLPVGAPRAISQAL